MTPWNGYMYVCVKYYSSWGLRLNYWRPRKSPRRSELWKKCWLCCVIIWARRYIHGRTKMTLCCCWRHLEMLSALKTKLWPWCWGDSELLWRYSKNLSWLRNKHTKFDFRLWKATCRISGNKISTHRAFPLILTSEPSSVGPPCTLL